MKAGKAVENTGGGEDFKEEERRKDQTQCTCCCCQPRRAEMKRSASDSIEDESLELVAI